MKLFFAMFVALLISATPAIAANTDYKHPAGRPKSAELRNSKDTLPRNALVERDAYVAKVESDLSRFEKDLAELRADREREPKESARFRELDQKIAQREKRTGQIREDVASLRIAPAKSWTKYELKIDENLNELSGLTRGRAE